MKPATVPLTGDDKVNQNLDERSENLASEPRESPLPAPVHRIYLGRLPKCGCVVAATIDAEDVGEMARNGYLIETVMAQTVEVSGCKCASKTEPIKKRPLEKLSDGEPRCFCTHGLYSHYMCGSPTGSRCLTGCGCRSFAPAKHNAPERDAETTTTE